MQHINPMPPHQTGEAELVPENIFFRPPEQFRHGDQFHGGGRKLKQRQVFLQHKQDELVWAARRHKGSNQRE
jgi:hypothetical protein